MQSALASPTVGTDRVWEILKNWHFTSHTLHSLQDESRLEREGETFGYYRGTKTCMLSFKSFKQHSGRGGLLRSLLASLFLLSSLFLPSPHPGILPDLGSAAGKSDDPELWSYSHVGR